MGVFRFLFMKYASIFHADKVASHRAMMPAIDVLNLTLGMARPGIQEKIKSWDLTNPSLVWTLGADIAGFIDAAHQTGKSGTTIRRWSKGIISPRSRGTSQSWKAQEHSCVPLRR